MSRLRTEQRRQFDSSRPAIIARCLAGEVVPIISDIVSTDLVFGQGKHRNFITAYTETMAEQQNDQSSATGQLSWITQHSSIMRASDLRALKEEFTQKIKTWMLDLADEQGADPEVVAEAEARLPYREFLRFCAMLGYPRFAEARSNPLMVLANLDLPIYLTTSYDYFIEMALRQAGKAPRTAVYPWRTVTDGIDQAFYFDQDYKRHPDPQHMPTVTQPLVYHLHGLFDFPSSLVVTEDDYMEFLIKLARDRSTTNDPCPSSVRTALESKTLLLLGYKLRNWDFRTLFWGMIKSETKQANDVRHTCVQLEPDDVGSDYLQKYLDRARFDVYEGDIYRFASDLSAAQ